MNKKTSIILESNKPLHLFGSTKQYKVTFPLKCCHTKPIRCSNIDVSLNLYMHIIISVKFNIISRQELEYLFKTTVISLSS